MDRFDKLLVLDLDETLIWADETRVVRPDFEVGPYKVQLRPGVARFLAFALAHFRVGVWTSSSRDYAEPVVAHLLHPSDLSFLWARERCTYRVDWDRHTATFHKDIRKLRRRGWDERRILYVDDSPEKIARSYGNLVRVRPFEGDPDDEELAKLELYLRELGPCENVRTIEKRGWRGRYGLPPLSAEEAGPAEGAS